MGPTWIEKAIFYHIYPLGLTGAPRHNDFSQPPVPRLEQLYPWLDHLQRLGVNALYLGPLFESTAHGYDTVDYFKVDRRLGDTQTLAAFGRELHRRGMRLVLDGVFNHTGRDFWAFQDVLRSRAHSSYASWFAALDFNGTSPYGDPFRYQGWSGHYDLVKLNTQQPELRQHLFDAVRFWIETFEIDGLRLDAADQLEPGFLDALSAYCTALRSDFWLMGEVVFGDYRSLVCPGRLHSATNYELYKSLYSSHVDRNYFELAYALNRQFGPGGMYRGQLLYSFADNHDVDRVASCLKNPAHLYPLYCLLFSAPGVPSVYYGSEWGLAGQRTSTSDAGLRPALDLSAAGASPHPELAGVIARLAALRQSSPALRLGDYQQLHVAAEQFAFLRSHPEQRLVVVANAAPEPAAVEVELPVRDGTLHDLLNPGESFPIQNGRARIDPVPPTWARILQF